MMKEIAYSLYATSLLFYASTVNRIVPEPYMDEIFHIPQAQAYCRGDWSIWDPSITTPPGLYLPASIVVKFVPALRSTLCSVSGLRATNILVLLALPFLYSSLLDIIRTPATSKKGSTTPQKNHLLESISISLFPLVYFFGGLFYTDLGGLILVLASYRAALSERWILSAVAGAISLLFRQTNIIWIGFIAASAIIRRLESSSDAEARLTSLPLGKAGLDTIISSPATLVRCAMQNLNSLIPILFAYIPVLLGAVAFVFKNGGIVLGDKTNHVPSIHLPQLFYFTAFAAIFLLPQYLSLASLAKAGRGLFGTPLSVAILPSTTLLTSSVRRAIGSVATIAIMWWCIEHFTIAHPFLLADNRHYAFYAWRRIINVHPLARYALAPGHLFAGRLIWDHLVQSATISLYPFLIYVLAVGLSLVPTPLIEPRYFIIPYIVLRIHTTPSGSADERRRRIAGEAAMSILFNVVPISIFLYADFRWTGSLEKMRFMW